MVWSLEKKSERSKPIKIPSLKIYDQFSGVFSENEENDAERSTHQDTNFNSMLSLILYFLN